MINASTDLNTLFNLAVSTLSDVQTGEKFIVRDLFRGFEWSRIPKGVRTKLGAMFFAYAQNQGSGQILPLGKTPQNQQIYERL